MNLVDKIASELRIDASYILRIANNASHYYKEYSIPKRNGEKRYIEQPSAELKTLQYWLVHSILCELPISKAAYAYKKGDSIKKHANAHKEAKFVLHTDIKRFFPSITPGHLEPILRNNKEVFERLGLDLDDAIYGINKICFKNGRLSIGAVSSPIISNIIMYDFDVTVMGYCENKHYTYTRYADDIYISSKSYIDNSVLEFINEVLSRYNFNLNKKKTRFYSPKHRGKITGLIITDDSKISVGTEQRNRIKKMVYNKLVNKKGDPDQVLGYLSYLKDIEPITYNNLIIKYSKYCTGDVIAELRK